VGFDTFDKGLRLLADKKSEKTKSKNNFGTASRFPDINKKGSKGKEKVVGPQTYDVTSYWPGKELKKGKGMKEEEKKFDILKKITKGVEKSIYYS
jgi:hypothetical protein